MSKRLIAAIALCAGLTAAPLAAQVIIEQILVRVNGEILTKTELEERQIAVLQTRPELANVTPESLILRQAVSEVTPAIILDAVDEMLLVQRGRELGLVLGDAQFDSIVENIQRENNLLDDSQFQLALQDQGMTMADLRQVLERQMLVQEVIRRDVVERLSVTEEEAREYYEANRGEFTSASEITLREILIEVPTTAQGFNAADDDAARAEAEEVRARLVAGEPFPQLAAQVSDAPSRANGGLIGPIRYEELAPALQAQIDMLQVGDLTPVTRTQRGYQILKLESRSQSTVRPFEAARDDIMNTVGQRKIDVERLRYLERLRDQATITWRSEELRRAYEQALAARQETLAG